MNIAYNWLSEYVALGFPPERVAEYLTNTGLEVGGLDTFESVPGGLQGLVIGEVLTCDAHPNADRLRVTTVSTGTGDPVPIVCGAPNVAAGQKVVVALPGTTLYPSEGEPFTIKKGKIRGESSQGMICAEDEIGLGSGHDGILVLPEDAQVGQAAADHFKPFTDTVIEIDLTPNRADAASHYGVARDLYALAASYDDWKGVELKRPDVDSFTVASNALPIEVEVENQEACPRYAGVTLQGLTVGESPEWLQNRLRSIGLSPINNVVDVTNFVMHEVGQPLHAFDANQITGGKVVVKTMPEGASFVTLDGEERTLSERDLMICNAEEGMCIAGVFGGLKSGVSESTTSIFLESAYFDPVWVRKTAKRHGLHTDASFRFERGVDPDVTIYALKRAALLIQEVAGGTVSSEIVDIYPEPVPPFEVSLNLDHMDRLAGMQLPENTVADILERLEIEITSRNGRMWRLRVPAFRVDVTREADVIEEVMRIYGYERIPLPEKLGMTLSGKQPNDAFAHMDRASDFLVSRGFLEGMSNSQTRAAYLERYSFLDSNAAVVMQNPLSSELEIMRQTLLMNGLEAVRYNQNRQEADIKLFEWGRVYSQTEETPEEQLVLGITACGSRYPESWQVNSDPVDLFYLKGLVQALFEHMGIREGAYREQGLEHEAFAQGIRWTDAKGTHLGYLGEAQSALLTDFDLRQPVYYAELSWEAVRKVAARKKITYQPAPKYPKVRRDLALLVDASVTFGQLRELAQDTERKLLKHVDLFDVYEGKNLEAGKRSYAIRLEFRDERKTLTDKQVDKAVERILSRLRKELHVELR